MSSYDYFDILPFDPLITPNPKIELPINMEDLARQLSVMWPSGEIVIHSDIDYKDVELYITVEGYGPRVIAQFLNGYNTFHVSYWPKRMAKSLILWYRSYIPQTYPLFLVIHEPLKIAMLTASTSIDDLENLYPYPIPNE